MRDYYLKMTPYQMLMLKADMEDRLKYNGGFSSDEHALWLQMVEFEKQFDIDDAEYKRREAEKADE